MSPGDAARRPGGVGPADGVDRPGAVPSEDGVGAPGGVHPADGVGPERLLSAALRAEAGRRGVDTAALEAADTAPVAAGTSAAPPIAAGWVLLLAILLGLAAGAVIALLTLV